MHNEQICKPTRPVEHNAQFVSLHGHVPFINLKPSLHFVHLPYSGVLHSSQEYSKQVEFPEIIFFINIYNLKNLFQTHF